MVESSEGDFLRVVPERDEVGFAVYKLVCLKGQSVKMC